MGRLWPLAVLALWSATAAAQEDGGEPAIEAFEPLAEGPAIEQFAPPAPGLSARVFGGVHGHASLDTRFDSPPRVDMAENVAELKVRANLGIDVKLNDTFRVFIEGKAQLRGVTQRDFERTKGFFEPMLGDAFVDVYTKKVDLRVGNQRISMGANAGLAAADALNPKDLRESILNGEPEDLFLPVFAARAMGEVGKVSLTFAYVPFFTPHRYFVFGQDEALLQPAAEQTLPNRRIDPSIEDYLHERALESRRPPPFLGDVALRAVSTGELKVGASWAWVNEKVPRVVMDGELQALLRDLQAGRATDPALAASVSNRLQAGETLYRGDYLRQHIFSLEGSRLIGPGQLDADVSFSPRQTFVDQQLQPVSKAAVSWVISYSQAADSPLLYGLTWLGMAVPGVGASEQLFLIEPATALGADRVAWFHLLAGYIGYPFFDRKLELSLRAVFEVVQKGFALAPRVTWQGVEGLKVWLAAEFYEGTPYGPLGYLGRNDKVLLGVKWEPL
jgi:hypothetical protein